MPQRRTTRDHRFEMGDEVLVVGAGICKRLRGSTYPVIAIVMLVDLPAEFRIIMPFSPKSPSGQAPLSNIKPGLPPWLNETT